MSPAVSGMLAPFHRVFESFVRSGYKHSSLRQHEMIFPSFNQVIEGLITFRHSDRHAPMFTVREAAVGVCRAACFKQEVCFRLSRVFVLVLLINI